MIPKLLRLRKDNAAKLIQRYVKGYKVYKKYFFVTRKQKLKDCFDYFKGMRKRMYEDS
jgi:hypothetical protein